MMLTTIGLTPGRSSVIDETGIGLTPANLDVNPPEEYPFFKPPFIDDKEILHWFAYVSDETIALRDLPMSKWLEHAGKEFNLFAENNNLTITEPLFTVNVVSEYAFREIHARAGLINKEN